MLKPRYTSTLQEVITWFWGSMNTFLFADKWCIRTRIRKTYQACKHITVIIYFWKALFSDLSNTQELWINGWYNVTVGAFTFLDGATVSPSLGLWANGEPTADGCVRIVENTWWRDMDCGRIYGFICERNITDGNVWTIFTFSVIHLMECGRKHRHVLLLFSVCLRNLLCTF